MALRTPYSIMLALFPHWLFHLPDHPFCSCKASGQFVATFHSVYCSYHSTQLCLHHILHCAWDARCPHTTCVLHVQRRCIPSMLWAQLHAPCHKLLQHNAHCSSSNFHDSTRMATSPPSVGTLPQPAANAANSATSHRFKFVT